MRKIKKYNKSRILLACSTCMTATLSVPLVAQEAPLKLADVVVTAT
ncbi:MAG: hypothetical protein ACI9T7_003565, partial [Oleiphilaceae bacterium]